MSDRDVRRRVIAGLVGLALASGGLILALRAFRGSETAQGPRDAGARPSSSSQMWTGPAPEPILDVEFDDVYGTPEYSLGLAVPVAGAVQVAGLLADTADLRFRAFPMISVYRAEPAAERTVILHVANARAAAEELTDEVFPGAVTRLGTPRYDNDIEVQLGHDFERDRRLEIDSMAHVEAFLEQRGRGRGAEPYLSDDAAVRYERGEKGLSLYAYATGPATSFDNVQLARNEGLIEIAVAPILGEAVPMDDAGPIVEILQVGWIADADGGRRLSIVGAHRDSFPMQE